ncbi:hypothetical protein BDP27DRAFT_1454269 [Rhodocollybia butyracea]|uniref:Nephrocystin 3-like N-terminal domain-containing protein n=1 Tax=Rhodocollybia butyracea TaxID=206335 RepID=A0A9P5P4P9_9AGAR|nr:hypothetical protein BDP27DRAFT_1454269 [Rhodocollybia butyracea]
MTESSLGRDFKEQQSNPQAGADRSGSMFSGASNFNAANSQFQSATTINIEHDGDAQIHQAAMTINNNWKTDDVFAIRKWLKAPDPSTNFVAACDKRTPGTGEWILSDPQFVEWREATSGVLWIQGKVGSGKTFLSAAIIQELKADSASLCCYYYFDNCDNSQARTNARGLLQSLLLQMATRSGGVHPALHELYTKCTEGLMEPTTAELSATLEVVSKDLSSVFLVLDAMDECSEAFDVLKHLAQLKKHTCIAVTSRYLAETDYEVSWYIQNLFVRMLPNT